MAASLINASAVDAVVFDMGGVFIIRSSGPIRSSLARAGFDFPDDDALFHEAHHRGVRALSDAYLARGDAPVVESAGDFWRHFEHGYFTHLGVATADLERAIDVFARGMCDEEVSQLWRHLLPANIAAFHRIAAAGIPVAIVTNNDGTAEQQLIDFAIGQVGDGPLPRLVAIVDSSVVGLAKPDPAIFSPALEALGTDPARTLYVGDTVHADVGGATAAGMAVVQLDPYDLHADFDHARLPDVGALADVLLKRS